MMNDEIFVVTSRKYYYYNWIPLFEKFNVDGSHDNHYMHQYNNQQSSTGNEIGCDMFRNPNNMNGLAEMFHNVNPIENWIPFSPVDFCI